MPDTYFEDLYREELRRAEWRMLETALRQRRRHALPRTLIAVVLWAIGLLV